MSSTSSGRRELLSSAKRAQLLSLPMSLGELEKFFTLTPADRNSIAEHRTDSNRLGIAAQLWLKWEAIKLDRRLPPSPRWRPGWVAGEQCGAFVCLRAKQPRATRSSAQSSAPDRRDPLIRDRPRLVPQFSAQPNRAEPFEKRAKPLYTVSLSDIVGTASYVCGPSIRCYYVLAKASRR